jgi:hypothetical protein
MAVDSKCHLLFTKTHQLPYNYCVFKSFIELVLLSLELDNDDLTLFFACTVVMFICVS